MLIPEYLARLREREQQLADAFLAVAHRHVNESDVRDLAPQLANWSLAHAEALANLGKRYGKPPRPVADGLYKALFRGTREGGAGLLLDLQDLSLLADSVRTLWTIVYQAALDIHDRPLADICASMGDQTDRQLAWLCTRIKNSAPQVLLVAANPKDTAADVAKALKPAKHKTIRRRPRPPANAGR